MNQQLNVYNRNRTLIFITYFCMFTFGLIETFKGTVIPSIRAEFAVDYTHIGQMLFAASLGYLTATFFGGMATERYGLKKVFIFGAIVVIASTGLFMIMPYFYMIAGTYFLLGIGLGCFEVCVNALGAKIFTRNSAMMMNLVHFFFGIGAAIAPKYAGIFIERGYSWRILYLTSIVLSLGFLLFVLFTKFPETSNGEEGDKIFFREIVSSSKVWLIAIILGLFMLMEKGVSNWLVNYLQVSRSMDVVSSTNYLTWFFITFTAGRLVFGALGDKIGYIKVLILFTIGATSLIFAGIIGQSFTFLFSMVGIFISIMVPTVMALIMKEFTNGVGAIIGFSYAVSGTFNMVGHWIIGSINDNLGLGFGLSSVGLCGILALILLILLKKGKNDCIKM